MTSASSLVATTLGIEDSKKSVVINFSTSDSLPFTIGINNRSLTQIRDKIIEVIDAQWSSPSTLFEGPQIKGNASGGTTFSYPSFVEGESRLVILHRLKPEAHSNMLFSGSGFTRDHSLYRTSLTFHGFSKRISSGTTFATVFNGRQVFTAKHETSYTDDIYLYNTSTGVKARE